MHSLGGRRQGPSATNQSVKIGVAAQKRSGKPGAQRGNIRFQAFNFVASILHTHRQHGKSFSPFASSWLHTITSPLVFLHEPRDERSQSFALGCVVLSIKARRRQGDSPQVYREFVGAKVSHSYHTPLQGSAFLPRVQYAVDSSSATVILWYLPYDSKMEGGGHSGWSARLFWFPVLVFPNYLLKAQGFTERYSGFTPSASEHCQLALYLTVLYHEAKLYQIPTGDSNAPVYSRLTSKISVGVPGTFRPHFNLIGQFARVHDAFRIGGGSGGCPDRIPPTTCPGSPDPG